MKTVLNVKTDADIKTRAQRLAEHLGIPLSTVVNAYLREFVHSGQFCVSRDATLSPRVRTDIAKAVKDVAKGTHVSPAFTKASDAIDWLTKHSS
jgi:antitoxin component of RelBE/YafQ-DinJ toxin-antitoxin module